MTVSMGMLIFAGLAYALEKDEPGTTFYTLPQTLYWAIITMTSTGRCLVIIMMMMMRVMMIIIITLTSTGDQHGTATNYDDNT